MTRKVAVIGTLAAVLCAGTAQAQFVPSWQGVYLGVTAGYADSEATFDAADLAAFGIAAPGSVTGMRTRGNAFGVAGGFNLQAGAIVLGLEGDWSRHALRTNTPFTGTIPPFGMVGGSLGTQLNWMASARARAGVAAGKALLYGTAGLAAARTSGELVIFGLGAPRSFTESAYLGGWVVGAGIEFMLTPNWTAKAEISRTRLSNDMFSFTIDMVPISSRIDVINVRGGFNYRF